MHCLSAVLFLLLLGKGYGKDKFGKHLRIPVLNLEGGYDLGLLYDAKTDKVIPHSPWNYNKTTLNIVTRDFPASETTVNGAMDLKDKLHAFHVTASITASFLQGIITVTGSAGYLETEETDNHHAELTFKYHKRTHLAMLPMETIAWMDFGDSVMKAYDATHVITAIVYGADAVFQFSRTNDTLDRKRIIDGSVSADMDKGFIKVHAQVKLNLTDVEKSDNEKINCKFFGDIKLEHIPVTFMDSIKVYDSLPSLVNRSTAVPKFVYLTPIEYIKSDEQQIVQDISDELLREATERSQQYRTLKRSVGDVKLTKAYEKLPLFQDHTTLFSAALDSHENVYKEGLLRVLPKLRGTGKGELQLLHLLEGNDLKFPIDELEKWPIWKQREAGAFEAMLGAVKEEDVVTGPEKFEEILFDTQYRYVVACTFRLYPLMENFTTCIQDCAHDKESCGNNKAKCKDLTKYKSWLTNEGISVGVRNTFGSFKRLMIRNKVLRLEERSETKMIYREFQGKNFTKPELAIEIYRESTLKDAEYKLPHIHIDPTPLPNCNGSLISWNVTEHGEKSKSRLTEVYYVQYNPISSKKTWRERVVKNKRNTRLSDVTLKDFHVYITALCDFGPCALEYLAFRDITFDVRECDDDYGYYAGDDEDEDEEGRTQGDPSFKSSDRKQEGPSFKSAMKQDVPSLKQEEQQNKLSVEIENKLSMKIEKRDTDTESNIRSEDIEVVALGRPFMLGTFYDARTHQIQLGLMAWNYSTLSELGAVKRNNLTKADVSVIGGEEMENKIGTFELSAEITATFLGGSIEISGSARYLDTKTKNRDHVDVAFVYKSTTHSERLTDDILFDPDYLQYFYEQGNNNPKAIDATHVVTEIVYGANAVFRITKQENDRDSKRAIEGSLSFKMNKGTFSLSGQASVNLTDAEKDKLYKLSCEFHGDVDLPKIPSSFREALTVAHDLPTFITSENAVPMKVTLTPIKKLQTKAGQMMYDIKTNLIKQIKVRMALYDKYALDVGDLKRSYPYTRLALYRDQIKAFHVALHSHKARFQAGLVTILPRIRMGEHDAVTSLMRLLGDEGETYKLNMLARWCHRKFKESGALHTMLKQVNDTYIAFDPGHFERLLYNDTIRYLVTFTLHVYPEYDRFTECVRFNCQKEDNETRKRCVDSNCKEITQYISWLANDSNLMGQFGKFSRLVLNAGRLSENGSSSAFLVREGVTNVARLFAIEIYDDGYKKEENFVLPDFDYIKVKDEEWNSTGVTVEWHIKWGDGDHSKEYFTEQYSVKYRRLKSVTWTEEVNLRTESVFIPIGVAFEIYVRAHCRFGVCLEDYMKFKPVREILLIGGATKDTTNSLYNSELYSPMEKEYREAHLSNTRITDEDDSDSDWVTGELTHHVAALLTNRHVLIAGGSPASNKSAIIDVAKKHFDIGPVMEVSREDAAAAVLDSEVWVCGGRVVTEEVIHESCEIYSKEEWKKGPDMLDKRFDHGLVVVADELYAIGGRNETEEHTGFIASVEVYTIEKKEWEKVDSMKFARSALAVAAIHEDIYVCGGENITDEHMELCERYNTERKEWEVVASMNVQRKGFTMVVMNGHLYVLGGYADKEQELKKKWVERYDPPLQEKPGEGKWNQDGEVKFERRYYAGVLMPYRSND